MPAALRQINLQAAIANIRKSVQQSLSIRSEPMEDIQLELAANA